MISCGVVLTCHLKASRILAAGIAFLVAGCRSEKIGGPPYRVSSEVRLAGSTSTELPGRGMIPVTLGPNALLAGDDPKPLLALEAGGFKPADVAPDGFLLPALRDRLALLADEAKQHERSGEVMVLVDAQARYGALTRVVYTIGQSAAPAFHFLVGVAEEHAISLHPPRRVRKAGAPPVPDGCRKLPLEPPEGEELMPAVYVTPDGFTVIAYNLRVCGPVPAGRTIPLKNHAYDYPALTQLARALKDRNTSLGRPSENEVLVGMTNELPFQVLVQTFDALRADATGALFPAPNLTTSKD
jgi:hypothetical protein